MKGFPHADYPDAVQLETPAPVHALPGFEEGWVTVQDASAQGCMTWLAPQNGEHILIFAPPRAVKQRIFLRLLQRRKFWRSILMSSASLAFTTI